MATKVTTCVLPVDEAYLGKTPTRLSWGAIFAGVVIAVAVQLVLGILGAGIGLIMVDPVQGTTPGAAGFGIGAGIFWLITTVLALGLAATLRHASLGCMSGSMRWSMAWSSGA